MSPFARAEKNATAISSAILSGDQSAASRSSSALKPSKSVALSAAFSKTSAISSLIGMKSLAEWTYKDLWREALFPLGVELVLEALKMIEEGRYSATPQDESLATWEPPTEQNTRLFRPELVMLG